MKTKEKRERIFNVRLTESEYSLITSLRAKSNKPTSQLIRDSLLFYSLYYNEETNVC